MQRWCSKLGRPLLSSTSRRLLPPSPIPPTLPSPLALSVTNPIFTTLATPRPPLLGFHSPFARFPHFQALQARGFAKERSRAPDTPVVSKVKKYKIKGYSSFKHRFRTLKDGTIRRWRAGKRHNAHSKSKKSKRRLRRPEVVHAAYAKVMKKLNFCA